jgi:hypothetical protein
VASARVHFPTWKRAAQKNRSFQSKHRNNSSNLVFILMTQMQAPRASRQQEAFVQKTHSHPLLVVFLLVAFTSSVCAQRGAGMRMPRYDPKAEATLSGTIDDIRALAGRYRATGTHLILKTDSGTIEVHVGPSAYIEKQQFSFAKGDHIEVLGSQVKIGGKDALLAREITKDGKKLVLRDQGGVPVWFGRNRTN